MSKVTELKIEKEKYMKEKERSEYRMYFFVPYNISDIQKGIQAGHAALEYARVFGKTSEYKSFIENDKTWIILNGGTTNEGPEDRGSLNEIMDYLDDNSIPHTYFYEPDLNDALTAVCFLVEERGFDMKKYPDYDPENFNIGKFQWELMMGEENIKARELIRGKKLA